MMRWIWPLWGLSLKLLPIALLPSCAYQFDVVPACGKHTIFVPYAAGDHQGDLTNKVIYLLASSGKFLPTSEDARYCLNIYFLNTRDQNVGFRYDRDNDGRRTTTLVPQETRTSVLVEVDLVDRYTGLTVIGPARVSANVVYDHEWYSSPDQINVFSLGQVTDFSDAKDAAWAPLNEQLAQKIVDLIMNLETGNCVGE